jgi:diguanylate cyclase (GGDEF)-like protein
MDIADRPWVRLLAAALLLVIAALVTAGFLNAQNDLRASTASAEALRALRATERTAGVVVARLLDGSSPAQVGAALRELGARAASLSNTERQLLSLLNAAPQADTAARLEDSLQDRLDAVFAERTEAERAAGERASVFSLGLIGCLALMVVLVLVSNAQRSALIQRLEWQATTDGLTGTLNRRAWDRALALALERTARMDNVSSVVMLDLDHFKRFNDRYGHPAGDKVLRLTAKLLQRSTRVTDAVARYGGEEFALCLEGCTPTDAKSLLERVRMDMPAEMTFSAGVTGTRGKEAPGAVLERADKALYAAKRAGRNRVMLSDELKPSGEIFLDLKSTAVT